MFRIIEIQTHVRGRKVIYSMSNPLGYTDEQYLEADRKAVIAFGNHGTKTIGTPL